MSYESADPEVYCDHCKKYIYDGEALACATCYKKTDAPRNKLEQENRDLRRQLDSLDEKYIHLKKVMGRELQKASHE